MTKARRCITGIVRFAPRERHLRPGLDEGAGDPQANAACAAQYQSASAIQAKGHDCVSIMGCISQPVRHIHRQKLINQREPHDI